jgi:hypothetical protein
MVAARRKGNDIGLRILEAMNLDPRGLTTAYRWIGQDEELPGAVRVAPPTIWDTVGVVVLVPVAVDADTAPLTSNDVAGTSTVDGRPDPAADDGYYYIVRAQTACANGTYGVDSANAERVPTAGCP